VDNYQADQLHALGDVTRQAILERLLAGPLPVGKLAEDFPVTRPAISQHLRVLEKARLVLHRSAGTRRLYQLNPEGFESLRDYFDRFWSLAIDEFKKKVEEEQE
jgi:DNA-binding transcriptional ArsR family regulator